MGRDYTYSTLERMDMRGGGVMGSNLNTTPVKGGGARVMKQIENTGLHFCRLGEPRAGTFGANRQPH